MQTLHPAGNTVAGCGHHPVYCQGIAAKHIYLLNPLKNFSPETTEKWLHQSLPARKKYLHPCDLFPIVFHCHNRLYTL